MTSNTNYFIDLFWYFAPQLPVIAIWLLGIILACLSWRKHPQVSLMALAAFGIQLFQSVFGIFVLFEVTRGGISQGWTAQQISTVFATVNYLRAGLSAVAWVLVLLAIFRWRAWPGRVRGYDGQYLPEGFSSQNIAEKT
ncbi:MAG: hypothetical protein E6K70_04395 [Planctomycetota bacterium]|nr:MAG: hypothetical protein E6K70_04395 [Planctomycetota bacterium]